MPAPNRSMGIKELADWLGASRSTVAQYVREGLGEAAGFKVGKQWRLMPLEVVAWLRDRPIRRRQDVAVQSAGVDFELSRALALAGATPRRGRKGG